MLFDHSNDAAVDDRVGEVVRRLRISRVVSRMSSQPVEHLDARVNPRCSPMQRGRSENNFDRFYRFAFYVHSQFENRRQIAALWLPIAIGAYNDFTFKH